MVFINWIPSAPWWIGYPVIIWHLDFIVCITSDVQKVSVRGVILDITSDPLIIKTQCFLWAEEDGSKTSCCYFRLYWLKTRDNILWINRAFAALQQSAFISCKTLFHLMYMHDYKIIQANLLGYWINITVWYRSW